MNLRGEEKKEVNPKTREDILNSIDSITKPKFIPGDEVLVIVSNKIVKCKVKAVAIVNCSSLTETNGKVKVNNNKEIKYTLDKVKNTKYIETDVYSSIDEITIH